MDEAVRALLAQGYTFEEATAVLALRDVTHMPAQLVKYWVAGAGAAKINWGVPGDFNRCRRNIQAEASEDGKPLSPHMIDGLCANLHKLATGATPGHAPGETHGSSHGHRSEGAHTFRDGNCRQCGY